MLFWKKDKASIIKDQLCDAVNKAVGYRFRKKDLLLQSLTHSSAKEENGHDIPALPHINERLEFLGDAVLGTVIAMALYSRVPDMDEGKMSVIKANLVSRETLAKKCYAIGLDKLIIVGKGIKDQIFPVSVLANAMEALFAAIYLEAGFDKTNKIILKLFEDDIATGEETARFSNYKALLQDYTQQHYGRVPVYRVVKQSGPKHKPVFEVMVYLTGKGAEGKSYGPGVGKDKKSAEQAAARTALQTLNLLD